jgi:glycogen debranching enzyme
MADAFQAAAEWIERRMSANKEGLLEYKRAFPGGIINQAWKDSPDSYFHADGTLANHAEGIASIEVQRVAYDALLDAAELLERRLGDKGQAQVLRDRAEQLGLAIMDLFWTDERGGYFVLGTDRDDKGNLRQLKIRTSNMGHLLHSRLLEGDDPLVTHRREAVIRQLFSKEMLGLNGLRTLASDEIRYRPGSYHNGSVWIWDNYVITQGLSQLGYHNLAHAINDRLLADINSTHRFPEYLRGDDDPDQRLNTLLVDVYDHTNNFLNHLEQPPQDIQAWSVAAIVSLKIRRRRGQHQTLDPQKLAFEKEILATIS